MSSNELLIILTEMSGNIGKIEGTLSGIKQKLDTIDERLDKILINDTKIMESIL